MVTTDYKLFTPLTIGKDLVLKNRIVMGPMGRARSDKDSRTPNDLNAQYYGERAGAGLIVSEATPVSSQGYGWLGSPALYTPEHAAGWKKVVDRVHANGGKIFLQTWHMGRQAHSSFSPETPEVVSASAIGITSGHTRNNLGEEVPYESAELAKQVGFDGIEIHGANGYLVDQFLQSVSNKRADQYGGSIENRARFLLELIEALKTVWPSDRIAVRLSPNGAFADMGSEDNVETFTYVLQQLSQLDLAYVAILDGFGFGYHDKASLMTAYDIKSHYKGIVIAANSYTRDIAEGAIRSGAADAVCFARPYISNPDLAERFQNNWPLNPDAAYADFWDSTKGAEGYTTFPAYNAPDVTN